MDNWKQYLDLLGLDEKLLKKYRELRVHFQELGFRQDQLNDPPTYTATMMNLMESIQRLIKDIRNDLKHIFNLTDEEINEYVKEKMQKVDDEIPLP